MIVLIVIHLMIVIAMIGVVLLQRSEGGGLGVGQTGGFLSSRGTANVLTRTTAILAAAFFVMSLGLSVVAGLGRKGQSILQNTGAPPPVQAPSQSGPPAPLGGPGGGVLNQLQKGQPAGQPAGPPTGQPAAPPAPPSGPQVPRSK
jgi:preprotein translocase subunit SecG